MYIEEPRLLLDDLILDEYAMSYRRAYEPFMPIADVAWKIEEQSPREVT